MVKLEITQDKVTLTFIDLEGSTPFTVNRDPEVDWPFCGFNAGWQFGMDGQPTSTVDHEGNEYAYGYDSSGLSGLGLPQGATNHSAIGPFGGMTIYYEIVRSGDC